jgi:hypothetical protein
MKEIQGYELLKAFHQGQYWYLIDCQPGNGDPFLNTIGGYFNTFGELLSYVQETYTSYEWSRKFIRDYQIKAMHGELV